MIAPHDPVLCAHRFRYDGPAFKGAIAINAEGMRAKTDIERDAASRKFDALHPESDWRLCPAASAAFDAAGFVTFVDAIWGGIEE